MSSSSPSNGVLMSSFESVPQAASSTSDQPSSSSSVSRIKSVVIPSTISSGLPSPSVSNQAAASSGKASGPAVQMPAGIAGADGPSQTPSPSVSALDELVIESAASSASFKIPSPSISRSSPSQIVSPSRSVGMLRLSNESEPQVSSAASVYPSLSSSSSATKLPM